MGMLELNCCQPLASSFSISHSLNNNYPPYGCIIQVKHRGFKLRAISAATTTSQEPPTEITSESETPISEEPPTVKFAFVSSVLLPDGSPDVRYRTDKGGQKLRDIMLNANVELYGPYARPLLNCGGGGTCGTCIVEVVQGKELLNRRTDKEKEKLKRNPKNWRLACQTMVGKPDSAGLVRVIFKPLYVPSYDHG